MRYSLVTLSLLVALNSYAQDTVRRVQAVPVTVSGIASPIDTLPVSTSYKRIEPTRLASQISIEQAVRAIPGVQIDNRNNYALGDRITMRGIGARSFFGTRGIRVIKDDITLTFADGQTNLEILDPTQLASLRVLRGPSSTIFGNASGGTLIFRSLQPPSPGTVVSGSVTLGSHGFQRFSGSLGSFGEDVAYGAHITIDTITGYRDWSGSRAIHFGTKATYDMGPHQLRFTFDNVAFSAQNPGALSQRLLDSNRQMAYAPNVAQRAGKEGIQTQAGFTYDHSFGASDLASTAYVIFRDITNPTPQQIVKLDRRLVGARITYESPRWFDPMHGNGLPSPDEPWRQWFDWALALDVQYQMDDRLENANDSGVAAALQTDQKENIFNVGAGLNATLPFAGVINLSLGARYDIMQFKATDNLINETSPDESGEVTMSAFSPSVGLLYTGLGDHHIFANATQSFESPTSTELANKPDGSGGYNSELDPQRITSFELGLRGELGEEYPYDDVLRYSIAGFHSTINDALIPFQVPEQPGRDFYRNTGTIENLGIEIELQTDLWTRKVVGTRGQFEDVEHRKALSARFGYTFVQSEFADYVLRDTTNLKGNAQPGVHPHLLSLEVTYFLPFDLSFTASMKHESRVAVNDANTSFSSEYTVLDLKLLYELYVDGVTDRPLLLAPYLHVNNVLGRKYIGSFAINAFGSRYYEPAPERMIFAGIQVAL